MTQLIVWQNHLRKNTKTKAKQGKIKVSFNYTLLIYIVNLNHREILVTKEATKPKFLVTGEKC